ncbi:MAG: YegS/Rv2252/BmrU family lipid kinase [Clostridia bacterium]|nr:YegS/Rv2252/BmrU family lipid kinase [Clostridia bacterium]MDD7672221.1 YegS/Rv2252/BmrU family lipid kinase [Clostridia bacterium]MDY2929944.1 YegS/Rv2252/BmrU family lipid kinase [Clostridiaceae bacterium]
MLRRRKLLFAVNAHAGKAAIRTPFLEILDTFVRSGYEPTVYLSQRAGELPEIVREEAGSYDLVVCSGGDGTLNEVVNGLMQAENRPALGYIPAGTTNDFATSLCIPKKMDKAAIAAVSGVPVWVDVGRFGQEYFAYVAAFGAFTDVAYTTPQDMKNSLGRLAYVLACAQRLTSLPSYHIRLEHDEGAVEDEILIGMVSNSSFVAGFPVGKLLDVSMSDGLMEVTLVRKPPLLLDLTRAINGLLVGELDPELIYTVKTQKLRVLSREPMPWTLDGEYGGTRSEVNIENLTRALEINVPGEYLMPKKNARRKPTDAQN